MSEQPSDTAHFFLSRESISQDCLDRDSISRLLRTAASRSRADAEDVLQRLDMVLSDLEGENPELDELEAFLTGDGAEERAAYVLASIAEDLETAATRLRHAVRSAGYESACGSS